MKWRQVIHVIEKVMFIEILTGLEKRVENLSETLNKPKGDIKKANQRWRTQQMKLKIY